MPDLIQANEFDLASKELQATRTLIGRLVTILEKKSQDIHRWKKIPMDFGWKRKELDSAKEVLNRNGIKFRVDHFKMPGADPYNSFYVPEKDFNKAFELLRTAMPYLRVYS